MKSQQSIQRTSESSNDEAFLNGLRNDSESAPGMMVNNNNQSSPQANVDSEPNPPPGSEYARMLEA
jgi:hypothetical protein